MLTNTVYLLTPQDTVLTNTVYLLTPQDIVLTNTVYLLKQQDNVLTNTVYLLMPQDIVLTNTVYLLTPQVNVLTNAASAINDGGDSGQGLLVAAQGGLRAQLRTDGGGDQGIGAVHQTTAHQKQT